MKEIISTTGETITFILSGTRKIFISAEKAVSVTEIEFDLLKKRLGNQISEVLPSNSKSKYSAKKSVSEISVNQEVKDNETDSDVEEEI